MNPAAAFASKELTRATTRLPSEHMIQIQDLPGFAPARRCRVYWPYHRHIEKVRQDLEVKNISYGVQRYYYELHVRTSMEIHNFL